MEYTAEFVAQEIIKLLPRKKNYSQESLTDLMAEAGINIWDTDFALR